MTKMDTARNRATEAAEALGRQLRRQRDRYSEPAHQERALYRLIKEASEKIGGLHLLQLDGAQLAELERHLRDLNLQADLAEARARDIKQATADLIASIRDEQRTR